ncbi:MAG: hypothetical protein P4L83_24560 [Nevskia sp.]|nr:hypothetical protein [Nevskia sp.]
MYKKIAAVSFLAALTGLTAPAGADDKPYKEGSVTEVAWIRVKDGKMNDYVTYLNGAYKQEMEAEKKAGIITDYRVYEVAPRRPEDANLILTTTYPNYAALDRTAEIDAIAVKVEGSLKATDQGVVDRGSIRTILGSELIQELILK